MLRGAPYVIVGGIPMYVEALVGVAEGDIGVLSIERDRKYKVISLL